MTVLSPSRGLLGLVLFVGAGLTFVIRTRHAATVTLHWYTPLVLALAGLLIQLGCIFNLQYPGRRIHGDRHVGRGAGKAGPRRL